MDDGGGNRGTGTAHTSKHTHARVRLRTTRVLYTII